jgi:aldehyde:ferredoxin oxidoreductase
MANKWYGWAGKTLRINLTNGEISKTPLNEEVAHNFLGGRGFNIKTLWDEIKPGIDPLSPENVLCFGVGPLVGTIIPATCRFNISAKSPETGILGDSNAGGYWAPELKFAGYDQIIVTGKAPKPSYVYIRDDEVEIRDASHLWGRTVSETEKIILAELNDQRAKVASIGLAGENLVRMAGVMVDLFRAAAATGMGAVMGSKKLKAIVVRGTKGLKVARPNRLEALARADLNNLKKNEIIQKGIGHLGTSLLIDSLAHGGRLSSKGDTDVLLPEEIKSISSETLFKNHCVQIKGCFNCPVHCAKYFEVRTGTYAGLRGSTGEFETIWLCGPHCGNLNLPSILKINNLCNEYGLNTISTGAAISFAIELYKAGIISKRETNGIELNWGDDRMIIELIHQIATREGLGNLLAENHYNMARILGKEAEKLCVHVKGLHRSSIFFLNLMGGLSIATSTRGADHLRGALSIDPQLCKKKWNDVGISDLNKPHGKHLAVDWGQKEYTLADCLGRCKGGVNLWEIVCPLADPVEDPEGTGRADIVSSATGWDITRKDLEVIAERVFNLERAFLVREGITRMHDKPPWKSFNVPIPRGPLAGAVANEDVYEELLDHYYDHMGWEIQTGIPTREKLEELSLKYVADELEQGVPYPAWKGPILWPLEKYHLE